MILKRIHDFKNNMLKVEGVNMFPQNRKMLGVTLFTSWAGTGALVAAGIAAVNADKHICWQFKDAETGSVTIDQFEVPPHWVTLKATLIIAKNVATTGNVVFVASFGDTGDGEELLMTDGSNVTATVTTNQNYAQYVELFTNMAVDPTKMCAMRLHRLGSDAADTFANNIYALGVLLERVS